MNEEYQYVNPAIMPSMPSISSYDTVRQSKELWAEIDALHALFTRMGIAGYNQLTGEKMLLAQRIELMMERPVKWNTTKTITREENP